MSEKQEPNVTKMKSSAQVVSTKMPKTIVVEVIRRVPHPIYKRIVTQRKKFYAHDEESSARRWATRCASSNTGRSAS